MHVVIMYNSFEDYFTTAFNHIRQEKFKSQSDFMVFCYYEGWNSTTCFLKASYNYKFCWFYIKKDIITKELKIMISYDKENWEELNKRYSNFRDDVL